MKRIVYWQNHPSIHQSAFVRALADRPNTEVWFAFEQDIPADRIAMGWTVPDHGMARLVDSRDRTVWRELVSMRDAQSLHLFGAYFNLPRAAAALRELRHAPCKKGWTTEAFNFNGLTGIARLWRSRWLALRDVNSSFDVVFAMGRLGTDFFERSWVNAQNLCEYAYLVEPPHISIGSVDSMPTSTDGPPRLLFVGQLIDRKGVDVLLRAIARMLPWNGSLTLIGDGVKRSVLQSLSNELGLSKNVRFTGNLSNQEVLAAMQNADFLVLPSRWDGWGAVVNEALMLGTRAIVSDRCGSSALVFDDRCGMAFRSENVGDLCNKLEMACHAIDDARESRGLLAGWASAALSADVLVDYVLAAFETEEPNRLCPPWRNITLGGEV